jgi:hypothetical protein
MMNWADREVWIRIGIVAGAAWFLLMVVLSILLRDFEWFPGNYWDPMQSLIHAGPAFLLTILGLVGIFLLCIGLPWILEAVNKARR